jgi:thiol-disulfide isomerase/thioredoxin
MKTKLALLFALLILLSCNGKKTNRIVVCGEILNIEGELSLVGQDLKTNSNINNNGKFKIIAEISHPNYYRLKTGQTEILLFLSPGDSINISFVNNKPIDIIQFTGDKVNEATYLMDYGKIYNTIADTFNLTNYYSPEPDRFLANVDNYKELFLKNLAQYKNLDKKFRNLEKQRINYIWAWDKNTYPKNHLVYARKKAVLPNNYFDYLKSLNLNDTSLFQLSDYTDFLKTYVDMKYFIKAQDDSAIISNKYLQTKMQFDIIEQDFSNSQIRDFLLNNMMISQIEAQAVDSIDIKKFNKLCTNDSFKAKVAEKFNKSSSILKGQPAPDFVLLQGNKTVSLTDFRGKYLYIDFWATTCSPCLREMPYLSDIENEFKGKNVAILGICLESTKEAWQKVISDKKPAGKQIWLNKELSDKIKEDFKITVEPTYVLIDKDGKYLDSRAPKPSENIRDVIRHLPGL